MYECQCTNSCVCVALCHAFIHCCLVSLECTTDNYYASATQVSAWLYKYVRISLWNATTECTSQCIYQWDVNASYRQ